MDVQMNRQTLGTSSMEDSNTLDQAFRKEKSRRPYKRNPLPYPLVGIVAIAIHSKGYSSMAVKEIVQSAKTMFPDVNREWQQAVFQVLSRYECFVKDVARKGTWSVDKNKIPQHAFKLRSSARSGKWADDLHDQLGLMPVEASPPKSKQPKSKTAISSARKLNLKDIAKQKNKPVKVKIFSSKLKQPSSHPALTSARVSNLNTLDKQETIQEMNIRQQTLLTLGERKATNSAPIMDIVLPSSRNSSFSTTDEYPAIDSHLKQNVTPDSRHQSPQPVETMDECAHDKNEIAPEKEKKLGPCAGAETLLQEKIKYSVSNAENEHSSEDMREQSVSFIKTEISSEDVNGHSITIPKIERFSESTRSVQCVDADSSQNNVSGESVICVKVETSSDELNETSVLCNGKGTSFDSVPENSISYVKTETDEATNILSEDTVKQSVPYSRTESVSPEVTPFADYDTTVRDLYRECFQVKDKDVDRYHNPGTLCPYQLRLHRTVQNWLNSQVAYQRI